MEQVRRGAREAGRDPGEIKLCARLGCAVSEDRKAARDEVRAYAAAAAETVYQSNPEGTLPPDLVADLKKLKEEYNYYEHVSAGAKHELAVTDRIIDSMVIAGTPKEVIPRFQAVIDLGVDRIVIPLTSKDHMKTLHILAEKVLPHLRG
jgi:alkanesulfonate monooxygenase SsuD/methylene tetrahydromethanopterin reductase-like flavin-dependent oxidoreductase (luciferase family)